MDKQINELEPHTNPSSQILGSILLHPRKTAIIIVFLFIIIISSFFLIAKSQKNPQQIVDKNSAHYANIPLTPTITLIPTPTPHPLNVAWNKEPLPVSSNGFFTLIDNYYPFYFMYQDNQGNNKYLHESYEQHASYYKVGTIQSGEYNGGIIYLGIVKYFPQCNEKGIPGLQCITYNNDFAFIFIQIHQNQYIITDDYDNSYLFEGDGRCGYKKISPIDCGKTDLSKNLLFRQDLTLDPNSNQQKRLPITVKSSKYVYWYYFSPTLFDSKGMCFITNTSKNTALYVHENLSSSLLPLQDLLNPKYEIRLPSGLGANVLENTYSIRLGSAPTIPTIKWESNKTPTNTLAKYKLPNADNTRYSTDFGGCLLRHDLFSSPAFDITVNTNNFTIVGTTSNGDKIYETDLPNSFYQALYQKALKYENLKVSFQDFLQAVPVVILKNNLGVYEILYRSDLLTNEVCMAEPLIYLYPSKTTHVIVKLSNNIYLTQYSPVYQDGWNVIAHPNGSITLDNSSHPLPFLYWEGNGPNPKNPVDISVVPQYQIHSYLTSELTRLGLNNTETKAFEDFWEKRLKSSPYYKLTFYGSESLNKIMPLSISPKPHTIIRVLMDYEPLNALSSANYHQKYFKTPTRNGFTVVELGGILH